MTVHFQSGIRFMRSCRQSSQPATRMAGFTLIELMITVAIVAVLASIALPSYARYIARAHRADARTQLVQGAQFMQRFYAANDSFKQDRSANAVIDQVPGNLKQSPGDAGSVKLYDLAIPQAALDNMKYTLHMVPVAGGKMTRDECGTFTLTSTGVRGVLVDDAVGSMSLRDICWQ